MTWTCTEIYLNLVRKDSLSGNIFPGLRKSSTVMSSPKLPRPSLEKKPPEGKTAWEDLDNKFNKRNWFSRLDGLWDKTCINWKTPISKNNPIITKRSMRRKSLNDEQFKKWTRNILPIFLMFNKNVQFAIYFYLKFLWKVLTNIYDSSVLPSSSSATSVFSSSCILKKASSRNKISSFGDIGLPAPTA